MKEYHNKGILFSALCLIALSLLLINGKEDIIKFKEIEEETFLYGSNTIDQPYLYKNKKDQFIVYILNYFSKPLSLINLRILDKKGSLLFQLTQKEHEKFLIYLKEGNVWVWSESHNQPFNLASWSNQIKDKISIPKEFNKEISEIKEYLEKKLILPNGIVNISLELIDDIFLIRFQKKAGIVSQINKPVLGKNIFFWWRDSYNEEWVELFYDKEDGNKLEPIFIKQNIMDSSYSLSLSTKNKFILEKKYWKVTYTFDDKKYNVPFIP